MTKIATSFKLSKTFPLMSWLPKSYPKIKVISTNCLCCFQLSIKMRLFWIKFFPSALFKKKFVNIAKKSTIILCIKHSFTWLTDIGSTLQNTIGFYLMRCSCT